ncbi:DUF6191 domain-containing protein [Streptomyces sp. NPDC091219]|uniref:DUF6191 domain-containing protein n=1 Tax=Streptomyces sp. NPDC091219 TaxID=3155193 RepID=UPI00344CDE44
MFNMFEELFSPGRKHTQDEANRLEMTRVDVADGDPGRGPIDLDSGRVVVRLPDSAAEPADDPGSARAPEPVRPPVSAPPPGPTPPRSTPPAPTTPESPESGRRPA